LRAKRYCGMFERLDRATGSQNSNNGSADMINNRLPSVFGVLVVLAVFAPPAIAVEEVAALATPGNTAEAQAFLGAKLLVCNTCHGGNGVPHNAATPVIWGQQENYLTKQLHDFHSDARNSEVMTWMATALTPAELQSAAGFFAKKTWPARAAGAAAGATPPALLAVCQACHQQNFVGGLPAPRLAGQKYEYLVAAMRDYAEGKRTNNTEMMRMMEAVSPDERDAIARYLSGL
jgi:cytochrome c553